MSYESILYLTISRYMPDIAEYLLASTSVRASHKSVVAYVYCRPIDPDDEANLRMYRLNHENNVIDETDFSWLPGVVADPDFGPIIPPDNGNDDD